MEQPWHGPFKVFHSLVSSMFLDVLPTLGEFQIRSGKLTKWTNCPNWSIRVTKNQPSLPVFAEAFVPELSAVVLALRCPSL